MNSGLATEATETTVEKASALPPLETWAGNGRMRHIPSVEWMIAKVDVELRRRIELMLGSLASAPSDGRRGALETELRGVCRALDRLAEAARHSRQNQQHGGEIPQRVEAALGHAVSSLRSLDADLIGRRFPYHSFDRSKGEPLYGALLVTLSLVERSLAIARQLDPALDERLMEGLVVLQNPVDERMLRPIA